MVVYPFSVSLPGVDVAIRERQLCPFLATVNILWQFRQHTDAVINRVEDCSPPGLLVEAAAECVHALQIVHVGQILQ